MKKVNVTTLKQLNKDVLDLYKSKYLEYLNGNLLDKYIHDKYNAFKVVDKIKCSDTALYNVKCDVCGEYTIEEENRWDGFEKICKCNAEELTIEPGDNWEKRKENIKKLSYDPLSFVYNRASVSIRSFFTPIIEQDDLLVIAQFNYILYVDENNNVKYTHSSGNTEKDSNTVFAPKNILILSEKFGIRAINPNTEKICRALPQRIIDDLYISDRNKDEKYISFGPLRYTKNPIYKFEELNDSSIKLYKNIVDCTSESIDEILFFKNLFTFKPKNTDENKGVNRFKLKALNKDYIKSILDEELKKNKRVHFRLDYQDEVQKTEFTASGINFKRSSQDHFYKCPECYEESKVKLHSDQPITLFGYSHRSSYSVPEKLICDHCNKDITQFLDTVESVNDAYVVFYDLDKKDRLVERIFVVENSFRANKEKPYYEQYRTICYEVESPLETISYYREDAFEEFKKVDSAYYRSARNLAGNVRIAQSKEEIKELLKNTSFEYSAFEDVLFSDKISDDNKMLLEIESYLDLWRVNKGLEKLARVEDYHYLLGDLMRNNNMKYLIDNSANNIKDLLKLSNNEFLIFKSTDKRLGSLNKVQNIVPSLGISTVDIYNKALEVTKGNQYNISKIQESMEIVDISLQSAINYLYRVFEYQRIPYEESIEIWRDYLYMALSIGRNMNDKNVIYPNSLKREHDVASYDYTEMKKLEKIEMTQDEKANFKKLERYYFNHADHDFVIISPKDKEDVILEGNSLRHCVASYANKVANGNTDILFMRNKKDIDKSLYTIEIQNNKVLQVKGRSNSSMNKVPEIIFFDLFCKKFNLS